ncbi:MAG: ribosome rescue protein RqcH [Thermoplasmata archaeon]
MKEQMESIEVAALVRELQQLKDSYLQKVYKPGGDEMLFRLHLSGEGKKMLLFHLGKALYLTEKDIDNPMKPGDFIMLLRKYLGNTRIVDVKQHEMDRVVTLELQGRKRFSIIFEIFGKGNMILTGEDKILLPMRSETWKHRELKEGVRYRFPPSRTNPFEVGEDEIKEILSGSDADLVRTLAVGLNLGGKYAEEVCARMGIDKNTEEFQEEYKKVFKEIKVIREQLYMKELEPLLIKKDGEIIDAVPFPLKIYEEHGSEEMDSYNEALDAAFELDIETIDEGSSRLDRKLNQQKNALENLKKDEIENKIKAELIFQNYQFCEEVLDAIWKARKKGNREEIFEKMEERDDIVQINDSDEYVIVELEGESDGDEMTMNVKLEFRRDVNENAQMHYEISKKDKKKIEGAKKAIKNTKKEIEEAEKFGIEKGKKIEPTATFWFDRYKWFVSSDGTLVIAGRDTKTNEEVVKKYLEKGDRYAHAEAGGAPSTVIKSEGEEIDEVTCEEACQFALIHSKEWKRGVSSGTAYWVKPYQVSKTAESGESLPTGAFVIRGTRNYIRDLPMEAVLVETEYKEKRKVTCAPSFTLENSDGYDRYVKFIPGKKRSGEFAKEMSEFFKVPLEEIQKILPPGDVNVIEKIERKEKD